MLKLYKGHKTDTRRNWVTKAYINFETEENFEKWYKRCIESTHCELCNELYKSCQYRNIDHDHETDLPRNIVCTGCNRRKIDREFNNSTDHRYIYKVFTDKCNQGFIYSFQIHRYGKKIVEKRFVDLNKIIKFRDEFIKNNPEYFS